MIISWMTISMLLIDMSKEENEVQWFFPDGGISPQLKKSQFLGWSMGSPGRKDQRTKEKLKTTRAISTTTATGKNNLRGKLGYDSVQQLLHIQPGPDKTWKTIVVGDSSIQYIPLEEFFTPKPATSSFTPLAEDAFDPFYLDPIQIEPPRQQYLAVPQEIYLSAPIRNMHNLPLSEPKAFQKTFQYPVPLPVRHRAHYPVRYGHPYYNHLPPPVRPPDMRNAVNGNHIHNGSLSKAGGDELTEPLRQTMFIQPKMLAMMKAMDRSILSYPSRFDYKVMDPVPIGGKQLPIKRHNNKTPQ